MDPEKTATEDYQQEFEQLFIDHFPALFAYGFRLSGDRDLTKDRIQSLFLELWEKRIPLDSVSHWQAYLKKSLHRRILKELQQKKRLTSDQKDALAALAEPSYEELLINAQTEAYRKQKVRNAMEELPLVEKEMLEARFKEGFSYEEIAKQTGKSKQTVYNQIYNAMKKLKKAVLHSFSMVI
ncbi:MAG: sigma-70 family RNA polymerase sigma factor [Bacteroidota bacterium]